MALTIISKVNGAGEGEVQKRERLARRSLWSKFQCHLPGGLWVPVSPVGPDYTPDSLVSPRSETLEKTRVPG